MSKKAIWTIVGVLAAIAVIGFFAGWWGGKKTSTATLTGTL